MKVLKIFSIKTKFVLIVALIVALFSTVWGTLVINEEKKHLFSNFELKGKLFMKAIKDPIINTMILQDMGMMPDVMDTFIDVINSNSELQAVYSFITDANGKVLAHSNYKNLGALYNDQLTQAALKGDGYRKMIVNNGKSNILDTAISLNISGNTWGVLRIGFSMAPIEHEYRELKVKIALYSILFFLVGTSVFYLLGHNMSRPLIQLANFMSDINNVTYETTFSIVTRRDEIGVMQKSFYDMLVRLKKSEEERHTALAQLFQNKKMAAIGSIVSGVAHEINNPLAAISVCAYKLDNNPQEEMKNCMELMKEGIQRIKEIVLQLLDFSRTSNLEISPIASDRLFREIVSFANMALKSTDLHLISTDLCPPIELHIDKGKFHQVALNIISNAIDASPPHGSIELSAYYQENTYCLRVSDQGEGIHPDQIDKIFDIFFTTKPPGSGTGIGLAVCRNIIDMHKGSIEVKSERGETVFTIKVPCRQENIHENT